MVNLKKLFRKKNIRFAMLVILIVFLFILLSPNHEGHENREDHEHCYDDSDCHGNGSCNNDNICVCNMGYSSSSNCEEIERPSWWSRTQWDTFRDTDKEEINTIINKYQIQSNNLVREDSDYNLRNSMCPAGEYAITSCSRDIHTNRSQGVNGTEIRYTRNIPQNIENRVSAVTEIQNFNQESRSERINFWNKLFRGNNWSYASCPSWRCINEETLEAWKTIAKFYIGSNQNLPNDHANCPNWIAMNNAFSTLNFNNLRDLRNARNWIFFRELIFDTLDQSLIDYYNQYKGLRGDNQFLNQNLDNRLRDVFTELRANWGKPRQFNENISICNRPTR